MQPRAISCFHDKTGYAAVSIEGRCSIAYVDDAQKDKNFSFKCHRSTTSDEIYPVNDVDFHCAWNSSLAHACLYIVRPAASCSSHIWLQHAVRRY